MSQPANGGMHLEPFKAAVRLPLRWHRGAEAPPRETDEDQEERQ
jgi:hypothetical protein